MLKKNVLRDNRDFSLIYNKGKSVVQRYVVIFYRKNHLDFNRTAFLASKKVGNSVERNRARRLMKESYRLLKERFSEGYDIIFVARKAILNSGCSDVKISMNNAAKKAGLIKNKKN